MADTAKLSRQVEVELSVEDLAAAFCEMDDDAQAQFFVHCARIAAAWPRNANTAVPGEWQWVTVGGHLRTCGCVTNEAREMVRTIYAAMVSP